MDEERIFERILLNNEYILKHYRPNKKRWVLNSLRNSVFILVMFAVVVAVFFIINFNTEKSDVSNFVPVFIMGGILLFTFFYILIMNIFAANNTIYVVTNKRLIAKVGKREDLYQYYDLKDLGYSQIRVTFLDRRMHPNTGTIIFSNRYFNKGIIVQKMNAPQTYIFSFNFIGNPYEVSKYITTLSEQAKLEE